MRRRIVLILCIPLLVSATTAAHDVVQPDWRRLEGTTYQEWRFDTGANPAIPEVIDNPYGGTSPGASALITVGSMGTGWQNQLGGMGTQTGYWDLGGGGGQIVLDIDNRPLTLDYKEIWVQVTYFSDITQPPAVAVPRATYLGGQTGLSVEDTGMGGGWFVDQSIWRIEPNPSHEQIILTSNQMWGSVIDQIVVDTICIPEPATIGLLFLGGLMILTKRQQRRSVL